jgi:hypothetical protein
MLDNLELYLATAALNGGKYQTAAALYMKVAVRNDSAEAWVGMGLCQLYQLAAGRTMDEVIFCFNKAKSIRPDLQKSIDSQLIRSCQMVLSTYVSFFNEALKEEIVANKKVTAALLLTGNQLERQQTNCDQPAPIVALGIEGTGVAPFKKTSSMNKLMKEILLRFHEIDHVLRMNVDLASKEFAAFAQMEITVIKIESAQIQKRTKSKPTESVLAKKVLVVSH